MLFLLDANVLIDANRDYYPQDRVPEFWDWLIYMGEMGNIKIPIEVFGELKKGKDGLAAWAKKSETKTALELGEEVDITLVQRVLREGYGTDLTDAEAERLGRDPFLVAHALRQANERCIVTTENSKPSRTRANKHLPNICDIFGVTWCDTFEFVRTLGFSTNWRDSR